MFKKTAIKESTSQIEGITIPKPTERDLKSVNYIKQDIKSRIFSADTQDRLISAINDNNLFLTHHILSEYGGRLDLKGSSKTCIKRAISSEDGLKMVKLLHAMGLDFDKLNMYSALVKSIREDKHDITDFLLEKGADINVNSNGFDLINYSIQNAEINSLKQYIKLGVKIDKEDVLYSIKIGNNEITDILMEHTDEKPTIADIKWHIGLTKESLDWIKENSSELNAVNAQDIINFRGDTETLKTLLDECCQKNEDLIKDLFNTVGLNYQLINKFIEIFPEEFSSEKLLNILKENTLEEDYKSQLYAHLLCSNIKPEIELLEHFLIAYQDLIGNYSFSRNFIDNITERKYGDTILENDNSLLKIAVKNSMVRMTETLLNYNKNWDKDVLNELVLEAGKIGNHKLFQTILKNSDDIPLKTLGKISDTTNSTDIKDFCKKRINIKLGKNWSINEELEITNSRRVESLYFKDVFNFKASRQTTIISGGESRFHVEHKEFDEIKNKSFIDEAYSILESSGYINIPHYNKQNISKDGKSPLDLKNLEQHKNTQKKPRVL